MKIPLAKDVWEGRPQQPICPSFCQFRLLCRHWHQKGMNQNFVNGQIELKAEACFPWYEVMRRTIKRRFDFDPIGMSAEEVFERVAERLGLEDDYDGDAA